MRSTAPGIQDGSERSRLLEQESNSTWSIITRCCKENRRKIGQTAGVLGAVGFGGGAGYAWSVVSAFSESISFYLNKYVNEIVKDNAACTKWQLIIAKSDGQPDVCATLDAGKQVANLPEQCGEWMTKACDTSHQSIPTFTLAFAMTFLTLASLVLLYQSCKERNSISRVFSPAATPRRLPVQQDDSLVPNPDNRTLPRAAL